MSPAPDRTLTNLAAAAVMLLGGALAFGYYGISLPFIGSMSCWAAGLRASNDLLQLGMLVAMGLLIMPATRATGIGLLVLGIAAAYALELLHPAAAAACPAAPGVP